LGPVLLGLADIRLLGSLITAAKEHHEGLFVFSEIDAVTGAELNSELLDALSDGAAVAEVAEPHTVQSLPDQCTSHHVTKIVEPLREWAAPVRGLVLQELPGLRLHALKCIPKDTQRQGRIGVLSSPPRRCSSRKRRRTNGTPEHGAELEHRRLWAAVRRGAAGD